MPPAPGKARPGLLPWFAAPVARCLRRQAVLGALAAMLPVAFSPAAADVTYRPYSIEGQSLPGFDAELKGGRQADIEAMSLGPVTIEVFAPLAAIMATSAALQNSQKPYRSPPPACGTPRSPGPDRPAGETGGRCGDAAQAIQDLLQQGRAVCNDLAHPERFVLRGAPGRLGPADLGSIPGLVAFAGRALAEARIPRALLTPEWMRTLRRIAGKLRLPELAANAAAFDRAATAQAHEWQARAAGACGPRPAALAALSDLRHRVAELLAARRAADLAGRAAAAAERRALRRAGRDRAALPFPSLTAPERAELSMLLGGIYWRMRGGGLVLEPAGTQSTRLYYNALPMAAIGRLNGGAEGWAAGLAIFSRIFEGWGIWMDMGRTPGGAGPLADLEGMTARGARQVGIAAPMLAAGGYDPSWLEAGGLHLGPVYFFAWERLDGVTIGADLAPPLQPFLEGPTAWGEALGGAAIAYGFARSLLGGRPIAAQGLPLDRIGR